MSSVLIHSVLMNPVVSAVFTSLSAASGNQTPPPDDLVTPGVVGFFAIFLVAVATVFLGFDLVRRIRRTTYREQIRERLEAEAADEVELTELTDSIDAIDSVTDAAATTPIEPTGTSEK